MGQMEYSPNKNQRLVQPRVIVHGGAGNITRQNLPPELWAAHKSALERIERSTLKKLSQSSCTALDAASQAVRLFEEDPLFNAGVGAVFTRSGTIELEASVMVSSGHVKKAAAVSLIKHVKNPVMLAAEVLRRGDCDDQGGAQGHVHLSGDAVEALADKWGLETCEEKHFWTKKRWQEHKRGLRKERYRQELEDCQPDGAPWANEAENWDSESYLSQGTVGCVAMDRYGTLAVASSTGGITNKLPGRIGDTPSTGSGFWAQEYRHCPQAVSQSIMPALAALYPPSPGYLPSFPVLNNCLPLSISLPISASTRSTTRERDVAVAMGGTGNGDSFLQLCAVRTAAARGQFDTCTYGSLARAVMEVAGPGGELQRSAKDRWGSGEGEGGIIGIQRIDDNSEVVYAFNCGGMFRCWTDGRGYYNEPRVFRADKFHFVKVLSLV